MRGETGRGMGGEGGGGEGRGGKGMFEIRVQILASGDRSPSFASGDRLPSWRLRCFAVAMAERIVNELHERVLGLFSTRQEYAQAWVAGRNEIPGTSERGRRLRKHLRQLSRVRDWIKYCSEDRANELMEELTSFTSELWASENKDGNKESRCCIGGDGSQSSDDEDDTDFHQVPGNGDSRRRTRGPRLRKRKEASTPSNLNKLLAADGRTVGQRKPQVDRESSPTQRRQDQPVQAKSPCSQEGVPAGYCRWPDGWIADETRRRWWREAHPSYIRIRDALLAAEARDQGVQQPSQEQQSHRPEQEWQQQAHSSHEHQWQQQAHSSHEQPHRVVQSQPVAAPTAPWPGNDSQLPQWDNVNVGCPQAQQGMPGVTLHGPFVMPADQGWLQPQGVQLTDILYDVRQARQELYEHDQRVKILNDRIGTAVKEIMANQRNAEAGQRNLQQSVSWIGATLKNVVAQQKRGQEATDANIKELQAAVAKLDLGLSIQADNVNEIVAAVTWTGRLLGDWDDRWHGSERDDTSSEGGYEEQEPQAEPAQQVPVAPLAPIPGDGSCKDNIQEESTPCTRPSGIQWPAANQIVVVLRRRALMP